MKALPLFLTSGIVLVLHAGRPATLTAQESEISLVPLTSRQSEAEARTELARQLSYIPGREQESLELYNQLTAADPGNERIIIERLGLLTRSDSQTGQAQAAKELDELLKKHPDDPQLLEQASLMQCRLGHAAEARKLCERAMGLTPEGPAHGEILLSCAREMRAWGDFLKAEKIMAARLQSHPNEMDTRLDWIGVLRAAQRWEEAEAYYEIFLLDHPGNARALLGLADTRMDKKDFTGALKAADQLLKNDPTNFQALSLRATALDNLHRTDDALVTWARLREIPGKDNIMAFWIGQGHTLHLAGRHAESREAFLKALELDPESIEAQWGSVLPDGPAKPEDTFPWIPPSGTTAANWTLFAQLLSSEGYFKASINAYRQALKADPEYFPALMGICEVLGANHNYEESIQRLKALLTPFPGNSKILLTLARVQSWSRAYEDSLKTYAQRIALYPGDYVAHWERARVASWAKERGLSADFYAELSKPSVDSRLSGKPGHSDTSRPYVSYEAFLSRANTPGEQRTALELRPYYRIQKATWLENKAKQQAWDRHFQQAEVTYRELITFMPGNQEAYFDLAQVQVTLGLNERAQITYLQLLDLDRLHSLATLALKREEIRSNPAVFATYSYWDEEGRDESSDMRRHRQRTGVEIPWGRQTKLRVTNDLWVEEIKSTGDAFGAEGASIEVSSVINEWLSASGGFTGKSYFDEDLDDTLTGYARIGINTADWAQFTFGYAREDVLHNGFALHQGTQSDNLILGMYNPLNHWLDVTTQALLTRYDDSNEGVDVTVTPGWIILDHPHTLKFLLIGEYRDTRNESIYQYKGGNLDDIIHPYWTPQDYYRGQMALEWRHDLSKDFFNGAELHYYAIRLRGGTDTTDNPSIAWEAEWHIEFAEHWTYEIKGMMERSPEWDGDSLWTSLMYRF